ncbi:MAG: O-antigen ligase family protein [Candidatus Saccharimonadales bacterium]
MGLFVWVSFIVLGIVFMDRAKELLTSRATLVLVLAIVLVSLYISMSQLRLELRLQGLLFQATTMGMFSVIAFVIGLYNLNRSIDVRGKALAATLLVASFSAVVLSQSRISYIAISLLCSAVAFLAWYKNRTLVVVSLAAVATILCLPWVFPNYFERFHAASIQSGTEYRVDLYAISGGDLLRNNILIGNGPSSLPSSINNTNVVPEAIKKSLQSGDVFLSTHNLFFDFAYYFGLVSCFALVMMSCLALFYGYRAKEYFLVGIFLALLANALTNVPSLELTSLYFVLLFALLYTARRRAHED